MPLPEAPWSRALVRTLATFASIETRRRAARQTSWKRVHIRWGITWYVAQNRINPEPLGGQRLIAHELAHVVQQQRGVEASAPHLRSRTLEQAADGTAASIMDGSLGRAAPLASAPALALQAKPGAEERVLRRLER